MNKENNSGNEIGDYNLSPALIPDYLDPMIKNLYEGKCECGKSHLPLPFEILKGSNCICPVCGRDNTPPEYDEGYDGCKNLEENKMVTMELHDVLTEIPRLSNKEIKTLYATVSKEYIERCKTEDKQKKENNHMDVEE